MTESKNDFQKIKDRICNEQQFGDVKRACKNAGVTTVTYQTAMKRGSVDELKDKEFLAVSEFLKILDERKASRQKLLNKC